MLKTQIKYVCCQIEQAIYMLEDITNPELPPVQKKSSQELTEVTFIS